MVLQTFSHALATEANSRKLGPSFANNSSRGRGCQQSQVSRRASHAGARRPSPHDNDMASYITCTLYQQTSKPSEARMT